MTTWKTSRRLTAVALLCLFAMTLVIAACSAPAEVLTGAPRDAVLAYSEPQTAGLLSGLNANDYALFSRGFDDKMKTAMTPAAFATTQDKVVAKIGKYVSRQVDSVVKQGDYVTVIYLAAFEGEDKVTVRVSFAAAAPHGIAGLWFDSVKLRQ
jgi:hypothetical protein